MKFEKLTENKIRIILTMHDLEINNIDFKSVITSNQSSQDLLNILLGKAEKEVGFVANDSRLLVEAIASTDGSFIFTITKLNHDFLQTAQKKRLTLKKKMVCSSENMIFKFKSFNDFSNFCTYISGINCYNFEYFSKNVILYFYKDAYYLCVLKVDSSFKNIAYVLSEFAIPVNFTPSFEGILAEHGKLIFKKDAIKKYIKSFKKYS